MPHHVTLCVFTCSQCWSFRANVVQSYVISCDSRGALLLVPVQLVTEWFSLGFLRLLARFDVSLVLALVAIAYVCQVDRSALSDQSWFPYEHCNGLLIAIKAGVALKQVLLDGSKERYNGGNEVCLIYRKEFEFRGMTKEFLRVAWLRYVSGGDHY